MSNSTGSYAVTRETDLRAYDKLPPSARKALQDAALNWACPPLMTRWRNGQKGFKSGKDIAARIAEWERQDLAKRREKK